MKLPSLCHSFYAKYKTLSRNRLKQQGVDCTSYRPSPENCIKNGKNQHVSLFSPTMLYETNQSASSQGGESFFGTTRKTSFVSFQFVLVPAKNTKK